jgi:hypothetical protein
MRRNSLAPWLAIAVPLVAAGVGDARRLPDWPYEKLFKEADLVVIAEPQGTASTKDDFGDNPWPLEAIGRETTFRVAHVLKGEPGKDPIKVLHFAFGAPKAGEGDAPVVRNGPGFVAFRTKEVTADTADRAHDWFTLPRPQYLLFLRKRADGRYEPVSGQTDPNLSVREVLPPAWSEGLRAAEEPARPPKR